MIISERGTIPNVVVSTITGHTGGGMFPLYFTKEYRHLMDVILKTGTIRLSKSATRYDRLGNFIPWDPRTYRFIQNFGPDTMLNAYGLTNNGVEVIAPKMRNVLEAGGKVIPNYFPEFIRDGEELPLPTVIRELQEAISIYRQALHPYFWAMEISAYCPNSTEKIEKNISQMTECIRQAVNRNPDLTFIVKISILHPYEFVQELERISPKIIIHAVNSVPFSIIFPGKKSPLADVGGGAISGRASLHHAFGYCAGLRQRTKLRMIMGNGIGNLPIAEKYFDLGADCISLCTVCKRNPLEAENILTHYNRGEEYEEGNELSKCHQFSACL